MSVQAEVQPPDAPSFLAKVANLTPSTVFVITDRAFPFRSNLLVRIAGLVLKGEAALSVSAPVKGVLVRFQCDPAELVLLNRLVPHVQVLGELASAEPWRDQTAPSPDEVSVEMSGPFTADSTPGEVSVTGSQPSPWSERTNADTETVQTDELPTLAADGGLHFASPQDFVDHWQTTIARGGLVAKARPLAIGTPLSLRIHVPELAAPYALRARVGYVGEGTLGMIIDRFDIEKPKLERIAAALAAVKK